MLIGLRITSWYHDRTAREVARARRGGSRLGREGAANRVFFFGNGQRGRFSDVRSFVRSFAAIARKMKRFNPARFEPRL